MRKILSNLKGGLSPNLESSGECCAFERFPLGPGGAGGAGAGAEGGGGGQATPPSPPHWLLGHSW